MMTRERIDNLGELLGALRDSADQDAAVILSEVLQALSDHSALQDQLFRASARISDLGRHLNRISSQSGPHP